MVDLITTLICIIVSHVSIHIAVGLDDENFVDYNRS